MSPLNQKISLQHARFFAFHGLYDEEQLVGTEFIVDIETTIEVSSDGQDDISNTVNYEQLYDIVSAQMKIRRHLIETVGHAILEELRQKFKSVKTARVSIRKMHPPLGGEVESSLVELVYSR